jgi:hypothetical protein
MSSIRRLVQRVIGDRPVAPIVGLCIGFVLGLAIAAVVLTGGSL